MIPILHTDLKYSINRRGSLVHGDHEKIHSRTDVILDIDCLHSRVRVKKLRDEEMIPCAGDLHHFIGPEGILVAGQKADDKFQSRMQIEHS